MSVRRIPLRGAVPLAHHFLRERVGEGDRVVDATCGNGQDTLLLAQLVGPSGKVWAFDLQESAIAATRELLEREGVAGRVELLQSGHEGIADHVAGPLQAAVFNLGYLPGGDPSLVTRPESTVAALQQALDLLLPGGILTIAVYTGHPGGDEEARAVEAWCSALPPKKFNVWRHRQLNRPEYAPYLVMVEAN
ncbi:class I SAM-dependent methyltransferase [Geomesophilobacter sediminis]|uniref:Class I SAM-dependent methyltransferase n=1 Tax=Geomesophilobacter sediminis TaxID=2798584 RepID=A0A8J7SBA0_9BACT|nr:class I SAM-dependent methyltransferase [Geomesophilobacter sediminis]MBJ6727686.1 class I SAM-dependent methyltransferase [Geomesophilobacter sediminis]